MGVKLSAPTSPLAPTASGFPLRRLPEQDPLQLCPLSLHRMTELQKCVKYFSRSLGSKKLGPAPHPQESFATSFDTD